MKRYYLSKIFLDTTNPMFPEGVWRHRLQTYENVDSALGASIKTDASGAATEKALLVLVGGIDHKRFAGDPDLVPLPQVGLDTKVSATHVPSKVAFKAAVLALGFTQQEVDDIVGNADGWRDVVDAFGRKNVEDFDSRNFDVDES